MLHFLPPALANSWSVISFKKLLTGNRAGGNVITFLAFITTILARISLGKITVCLPIVILTGSDLSK
jgi:hypothetical protein